MTFVRVSIFYLALCCLPLCAAAQRTDGVVATVNPVATKVGQDIYEKGGNAIDAAIGAAFTLGVVDCYNSGIGGGCFILVRLPDGRTFAIDGREKAPSAARPDMYIRDGKADPDLSRTGALAVGTPGALAAYAYVIETFGKQSLKSVILPAAEIADSGFVLNTMFAQRLLSEADALARFEGSRLALLKSDGQPYRKGEHLKMPDLAQTYRAIAENGTDWFYRGPFASQVSKWMEKNDGILSEQDFNHYQVLLREPLVTTYRNHTIIGFPPPSSGGVHVAQILNILENYDLSKIDNEQLVHLIAEAMKLAFADRAHWLGDPGYARVPRGLIDKQYAQQLAKDHIDLDKTSTVAEHGTPDDWQHNVFGKHTTHIAAADKNGYWVAITTTNNTPFGSKVIVPGTGVVLNNQMDDFSAQPGVPNAFGLVGAEANAIAAGKRPLSSMSPTIVLKDDQPMVTLGAAGGPRIITEVVLTIVRMVDRGLSLEQAVAAPRFHHQWRPDQLFVETRDDRFVLPATLIDALRSRGHRIAKLPYAGITEAVGYAKDGKTLIAVDDPRLPE